MKRGLATARLLVLMASCTLLGACAETTLATYAVKEAAGPDKQGTYKIGKPYQIQGVWYYPTEDYNYAETGIASWYGGDFHGKLTANGEVFDANDITAAHRTLPMPCFVRGTNLDNGRSLVVRVNDRGPFAHGRIIDVSRRAGQLLGIDEKGTAKVRVEIMAEESRALALRLRSGDKTEAPEPAAAPRAVVQAEVLPPPGSRAQPKAVTKAVPPPPVVVGSAVDQAPDQSVKMVPVKDTQIFVQAGAFSRYDNANKLSAALNGMSQTTVSQVHTKSGTFFRVRMGPIANVTDADALLEKVIGSGYPDAKIVVD